MARMRYIQNLIANKAAIQVPFICNDSLKPVECDFDVIFEWNLRTKHELMDIERVKELESIDSKESLKDEMCCSTDQIEVDVSTIQILADIIM